MTELHRAWLELVDTEGPFLAIPPLKRVWPQGMPALSDDRKAVLVDARKDFEAAWEGFDRAPDNDAVLDSYRVARDKWVETVLRDVAGWAESLSWGEAPGVQAQSPNRAVTVTAQAALNGVDGIGAVVHLVDPTNSLRQTPNDLWAATPVDRTEALIRENKVPLGIVTDGRWWGLVCAREGAMAASGIIDALTWIEEPRTRDAFLALIGRQHIIGGDPAERLPVLFEESVAAAEEITEALGAQVRSAVELLIQSFSESAADVDRRGLPDPLPARTHDTYEAAVTVMMRVVFLLFAEERGLLPSGELFDQGYGIARELDRLIARETEESEEALDSTSLTWHRLLATSQALFSGGSFESLRMPAYGGSLFDPERFRFLTAVNEQGALAVTVSDRVMLHVLRSVQIADIKGEARRISFRDIDVEQIGYIYEGLLGYTARKVDQTYVGLRGTTGVEPEIPLERLEELAEANSDPRKLAGAIRFWVEENQPSAKAASIAALEKALTVAVGPSVVSALTQAVGDDPDLRDRVRSWLGLIRLDLRKRPFVVLPGGLMVKETPSRKNAGAHYTPKSLAEEVVLHALQPLCYSPGPRQTADESAWKLKSSDELLDIKVADIACGSGAFLVAAGRYLADRLVEAWITEDPTNASRKNLHSRAIRQVVANCLYGADINDMAVEMCKLSLWLVSLDRDLPFSFVDDKVFLGNSLLGITSLDQLRRIHVDPTRVSGQHIIDIFDVDIDAIVRKAVDLRQRLASEIDESDPARSSAAKRRQVAELDAVTSDLRVIADGVIATGLRLAGKPGKTLDEGYESLRAAVARAYPQTGARDCGALESIVSSGLVPTVPTDYESWRPLHWVLEAPDVFVGRHGFDAIVGNPPFLGGKKISLALGSNHREWIVANIANGRKGNADLCAYFTLRAGQLANQGATLGLIGTDTLAQGDTREVGLDQMVESGWTIHRARRSMVWPTLSASVSVALVWATRGSVAAPVSSDGVMVPKISAALEPEGSVAGLPVTLVENESQCFVGVYPNGLGLVLDEQQYRDICRTDGRSVDFIRPYMTGKDLSTSPTFTPERWIIDVTELSLEQVRQLPGIFRHLDQYQRPYRASLANKPKLQTEWWRFERSAKALYVAMEGMDRVIAWARVSSTLQPVMVSPDQTFMEKVVVMPSDDMADFAVIASSIHTLWAIRYSPTQGTGVAYKPSDAFDTFPRPETTADLARVGRRLDELRSEIMRRRNLGLTKLYNLVNDSDVASEADKDVADLRRIHVELDEAVVAAYGWTGISLDNGFHTYRGMKRWMMGPVAQVMVLDHLLEENHRRAAAAGPSNPKKATRASVTPGPTLDLFGGGTD